jgi:hemoglobin
VRFLSCFVKAADDAGLPDDRAFRDGLRSYMEWAVAEVLSYSPTESQVPNGLPVPRWGWNGPE